MNKQQIDQSLIEACILEKWNPMANGCEIEQNAAESCVLCQCYNNFGWDYELRCIDCPIYHAVGERYCLGTPYILYLKNQKNSPAKFDAIEAEIEFLISLLPSTHPWRNDT